MEKEDKIAQEHANTKAKVLLFIRKLYPVIALLIVSVLRVLMHWYGDDGNGFRPYAAAFIFPIMSTKLYNEYVTTVVVFATQHWISSHMIFDHTIPTPLMMKHKGQHSQFTGMLDIAFNFALCAGMLIIIKFVWPKDKEHVLPRMVSGLVLYEILKALPGVFPPSGTTATSDLCEVGVVGEFFTLVLFIFLTGPIRIGLDTMIGTTSIEEMVEEYQERRGWIDKTFDIDERPDLLPTNNKKGGAVKRNVSSTDE
jgi:hypothetical protein